MTERVCVLCGEPARGFASIWLHGKESWFCHPDEGPSCYQGAPQAEDPPFAEVFWGGYLTVLHETGAVTIDTPAAEVGQIKAEFMAGMRGETS